jgi:hypothetical protein
VGDDCGVLGVVEVGEEGAAGVLLVTDAVVVSALAAVFGVEGVVLDEARGVAPAAVGVGAGVVVEVFVVAVFAVEVDGDGSVESILLFC